MITIDSSNSITAPAGAAPPASPATAARTAAPSTPAAPPSTVVSISTAATEAASQPATAFDPADANQDGTVSVEEQYNFGILHPQPSSPANAEAIRTYEAVAAAA